MPVISASIVTHTFQSLRSSTQLTLVAKRYVVEPNAVDGLTILFFHSAGSHKEVWEPIVADLANDTNNSTNPGLLVREAWSFDMPNHGEAASLSEIALKEGRTGLVVEECAQGVKSFFAKGALDRHRLLGVGHSLGVAALILTTMSNSELPVIGYAAMALIDPALATREVYNANVEDISGGLDMLIMAVSKRRDTWSSRTEARTYFRKRFPWREWDERVLELYVSHGLREIVVNEDGIASTSVVLSCNKENEKDVYRHRDLYFDVVGRIQSLIPKIPISFISGERDDLVPRYALESVMSVGRPASLEVVHDAGHFVVQENPTGLAAALGKILTHIPILHSKL